MIKMSIRIFWPTVLVFEEAALNDDCILKSEMLKFDMLFA
jgi:hypothetical protein